jgi:predicted ATPase
MINKISFKNYKLFKEKQTLELKPITILIGKNNSGKSAVLKLPTLIAGSLSGEFSQPFETKYEDVRIGLSPEDFFYNREITNDSLNFEVSENDGLLVSCSIIGDIHNNIRLRTLNYKGQEIDLKTKKVKGFIPEGESFKGFDFDYIEAFRMKPEPNFQKKMSDIIKVGINGENSYSIYAKYFDDKNPIYKFISDWYFENFENWKLEVNQLTGSVVSYEINLRNRINRPINIVNTGSGISQSFPLILRSFMPVTEPTLIIIEEPETHLHPAAHGNLAQRFVDSFLEDKNRNYLIETHSENFILRLQSIIADPEISFTANDLKIYYVDYSEDEQCSKLIPLEISDDGEIEDWPDNVFNESLDEVYKLRRNQKKRQNNANKN